jgi:hypothetical protein
MAPQTPDVPRRKRGRPPKPSLEVHDLQGFKFFKRLRSLLDVLRSCAPHPNRLLHYDEYAAAVLSYFFNPAITSLRGLQEATGFDKVQKRLGIRRMSLGSMSESVRLFDPELLAGVFEELASQAPPRPMDPRLEDLRQVLTAAAGTVLRALPRMTWAVWLRDSDRGAKVHVQFEVLRDTATHVEITAGQASEVERLKGSLQRGRLDRARGHTVPAQAFARRSGLWPAKAGGCRSVAQGVQVHSPPPLVAPRDACGCQDGAYAVPGAPTMQKTRRAERWAESVQTCY